MSDLTPEELAWARNIATGIAAGARVRLLPGQVELLARALLAEHERAEANALELDRRYE